jgi:hypothetical protein
MAPEALPPHLIDLLLATDVAPDSQAAEPAEGEVDACGYEEA